MSSNPRGAAPAYDEAEKGTLDKVTVYPVDIIENPKERSYLALDSEDLDGGAGAPIVRTILTTYYIH